MVAATVGWSFEYVTLEQHSRYTNLWGYVQYSRPLETRTDLDLWAPTFLAGQFGETALLGFAGPGASQDTTMVLNQIRAFIPSGDEQRVFFQEALQRAQEIIRDRQVAVRAVASALLGEQTLQATRARDVIELATMEERGLEP